MSANIIPITVVGWAMLQKYEALSTKDLMISNPTRRVIYWTITATEDVVPTHAIRTNPIASMQSAIITPTLGATVWIATEVLEPSMHVNIEVAI